MVSGRPLRPLPLRLRFVRAVLSPTVAGTCQMSIVVSGGRAVVSFTKADAGRGIGKI